MSLVKQQHPWTCLSLLLLLLGTVVAFQQQQVAPIFHHGALHRRMHTNGPLFSSFDENVESILDQRYPAFMAILKQNSNAMKALREGGSCTILAPNQFAFETLGEGLWAKLMDPRNLETCEKLGGYHVLGEPVSAEEMFNAGGLITLEGDIPVDRTVSGGFFGVGGQEDGGVTLNGAKVLGSFQVGETIVHEVDALVSPKLLLRYLDQLRIPGSK